MWITGHPTHTITCQCGDPSEEVWWLAWLPQSIIHRHDPFFTNALFAGTGGVNALANVSVLFPALVLSPITLLFGPIAAFNVAGTLAPVASGYCMFLLARKVTSFPAAAIVAGLVWGFSPFVVSNLPFGHLGDVLGFFPPLAGLLAYDAIIEHRRPAWIDGLLLASLVVAQFFTSTEFLLVAALTAPVGLVVGIVLARPVFRAESRNLVVGASTATVVAVAVLAYPAWFAVEGPRHVTGPPRGVLLGSSVSSLVNPGSGLHQPASAITEFSGYWGRNLPAAQYLGWGIVLFIAISIPLWYRRKLPWCLAVMGIWAWMLSWGASSSSPAFAPWRLLTHLGLLSAVEPFRFSDVVTFCAALLLGMSLDSWWRWARSRARAPSARQERTRTGFLGEAALFGLTTLPLVAVLVSLVPIARSYSLPLTEHVTPVPSWFTHRALRLQQGTRVLAIPYTASTMVYQAEDDLRFDIAGGYMLVPGKGGVSIWREPLEGAPATLTALSFPGLAQPPMSTERTGGIRKALTRWGIEVTVVDPSKLLPHAVDFFRAVYGRPPREQRGAAVWYGSPT